MPANADCARVWQDALLKAGLLPDPATHSCFVVTSEARVTAERFLRVMDENLLAVKVLGTGRGPIPGKGEACDSIIFQVPNHHVRLCNLVAKLSGMQILRIEMVQHPKEKADEDSRC